MCATPAIESEQKTMKQVLLPLPDTTRDYLVLGAGAIGGTLAHALARAGHEVTIVDSDAAHVRAINEFGLLIERETGSERAPRIRAFTPDEADDIGLRSLRVLLATKSQHTTQAAKWLMPHLDKGGFVISCQNGENVALIDRALGQGTAVTSFVNLFADIVGPGRIRDGGQAAFAIGESDGRISRRVLESVADLQAWGPVIATANVKGYLWSKHIFAEILSVSALVDASMADAVDLRRDAFLAIGREVFSIAAAQEILLERFDAFRPEAFGPGASVEMTETSLDGLTAWLRTMPKQRSGVWTDIMIRGRRTEAHEDLRALASIATELGILTPLIRWLDAALSELEEGTRRPSVSNLDELAELATRKQMV